MSSHHAPYALGDTHAIIVVNKGLQSHENVLIPKTHSQFGLQVTTRLQFISKSSFQKISHSTDAPITLVVSKG